MKLWLNMERCLRVVSPSGNGTRVKTNFVGKRYGVPCFNQTTFAAKCIGMPQVRPRGAIEHKFSYGFAAWPHPYSSI